MCLTTSKKLSLGEINRCYVQLVVRDYSQRCDSISPRASAVVPPTAWRQIWNLEPSINPAHSPCKGLFFPFQLYLLINCNTIRVLCMGLVQPDSCSAEFIVTWTVTVSFTRMLYVNAAGQNTFTVPAPQTSSLPIPIHY